MKSIHVIPNQKPNADRKLVSNSIKLIFCTYIVVIVGAQRYQYLFVFEYAMSCIVLKITTHLMANVAKVDVCVAMDSKARHVLNDVHCGGLA